MNNVDVYQHCNREDTAVHRTDAARLTCTIHISILELTITYTNAQLRRPIGNSNPEATCSLVPTLPAYGAGSKRCCSPMPSLCDPGCPWYATTSSWPRLTSMPTNGSDVDAACWRRIVRAKTVPWMKDDVRGIVGLIVQFDCLSSLPSLLVLCGCGWIYLKRKLERKRWLSEKARSRRLSAFRGV